MLLGERMLFTADDGEHGYELWSTDGTEAGTSMVADLWSGPDASYPGLSYNDGRIIYFVATREEEGPELWITDGTAEGTTFLKDVCPGECNPFMGF